tara:strand:- start:139 stop:369 length:231 start_codon:yes stop_codon:yes gene_type:complete
MVTKTPKIVISRQRRTLFLAVFTAGIFAATAVYMFNVDVSFLYNIFLMSVLLLLPIVGLAFIFSVGLSVFKNRKPE